MSEALKVLLLEDEAVDRMAFERLVRDKNLSYECHYAGSLEQAKALVEKISLDVVVADFSLNDGTALDFLRLIKAKNVPVVITTGSGNEEVAVTAMKEGAYDYLLKDHFGNYLKILPLTIEKAVQQWRNDSQLRLLSQAVISADDSIFITDRSGKIIFVNQAFCRTYNYSEKDILGKNESILWEERSWNDPANRRFFSSASGESTGEVNHRCQNGDTLPVLLSRATVQNQQGVDSWNVFVSRDISARKEAEEKISSLNAELQRTVKKLETLNEDLEAFSVSVSHDLRSPLNIIESFAEVLNEDFQDSLPEQGKDYLKRIQSNTRRAKALIENLLRFSRCAYEPLTVREVDLTGLIREAWEDVRSGVRDRDDIEFRMGELPKIRGDVFLLKQVFINLLGNALKFSLQKHPVIIEAGWTEKEGGSVFVRDEGVGFDPAQATKMFQPFQRFHSTAQFPGTGLGLAIVKRIVERHGGWVKAESKPGAGSTFFVRLPLNAPEAMVATNPA